ncbi:MAG: PPC domain-containing protein [Chloracidobacterium sp.]|nr:PPC domain-containing protein [Chloracidobacterium sp.]
MKELIDRISHPKPWMIVLFCFVTIFALLAFPLQSMRTGAQTDKELSSQFQKGGKIDTGGSVDVISIDPSLVPTDLDHRGLSKTEMTPAAADQPLATPSLDVEPNGTSATASPIAVPARVRGNLFPNGDIDFYSFSATAGDRVYAAVMTSASAGSSTDSQLTLLNSDGTTVNEFDDDNGSFSSTSSSIAGAIIPSTGTYFLKVNDFTAGTSSERYYELYVKTQSAAPTPEVEGNDTPATANVLPASGHVSGARNPAAATEQDWYSMTLNAGDTVYLSMDLDPEDDLVVWNGRLGMALFGDAANQILVVDDAGAAEGANPLRPSEALFMTVKTAGTYYAFVDSATAATGGRRRRIT